MAEFYISELHAHYDFERVIDLSKLRPLLIGTPYEVTKNGSVIWSDNSTKKHFSHKPHANGAFTMKYRNMSVEEATDIFRELFPLYVSSFGDRINRSEGFIRRNPDTYKKLKEEDRQEGVKRYRHTD